MNTNDFVVTIDDLLDCCPTNRRNYNQLLELVKKEAVVPFIGAGFSANMGYPLWRSFLTEQAEINHVPQSLSALKKNQFELAATLLQEKMHGNMENIMQQTFGDYIYKKNGIPSEFEALCNIFPKTIITTNYDSVIEALYVKATDEYINKITPKSSKDKFLINQKLTRGEPLLIKLHGDVDSLEFVLTENEYNAVYGSDNVDFNLPMPSLLRSIIKNKILLFLGCSLESDRTLHVIEQSQEKGNIAFALLELPEKTENKEEAFKPILIKKYKEISIFKERTNFLIERNIIPIWYPHGKHDCLKVLLNDIQQRIGRKFYTSITKAQNNLKYLLKHAKEKETHKETVAAYYLYSQAEDLLKNNSDILPSSRHLDCLQTIKRFYVYNGYAYEKREFLQELIFQTKKYYGECSLEMIRLYRDLAYYFEEHCYYALMLQLFMESHVLLTRYEKEHPQNKALSNEKLVLFTNLAYGFLKNNKKETAVEWYEKARELAQRDIEFDISSLAFFYNGLHRYYILKEQYNDAITTLERAMLLRKKLTDREYSALPQHLANTYSNKIRIYLNYLNDVGKASEEYNNYINNTYLQTRIDDFPTAKIRITIDYGDMQKRLGHLDTARKAYQNAINMRNMLHFPVTMSSLTLYEKIAETYLQEGKEMESREYLIHTYTMACALLGEQHPYTVRIGGHLYNTPIHTNELDIRLQIQRDLLQNTQSSELKEHESELIKLFLAKEPYCV